MSNAAIYLNPEAFDTRTKTLMGRHAAGESFLRGLLLHADVDRHVFWNVAGRPAADMEAFVNAVEPSARPVTWLAPGDRRGIGRVGAVSLASPQIAREAWARRALGDTAYGICGITHTTATARAMDAIGALLTAPVKPWDALICTSRAVRSSVERQLEATEAYLAETLGASKLTRPQLEVIPLGVNVADFITTPAQKKEWREKLGIADDTIVALYVGRFSATAKMNPLPMAMALERAAVRSGKKIAWVVAGWAPTDELTTRYHDDSRACCPSVQYIPLDGREPDVRFSIWAVGDIFLSLSDNVQETFGLTPVEAMAAGMPNVVSDWDGYRDTVRDGVDGFRIATYAPRPGTGEDIAYRHANDWVKYEAYVGAASQTTVVDIDQAARAIATLACDPDLRARMGAAARDRCVTEFDWSRIIPRYQALWGAMNARRLAEPAAPPRVRNLVNNPWRMDPFALFASYPTEYLTGTTMIRPKPDLTWALVKATTASVMTHQGGFALPPEAEIVGLVEKLAGERQISVEDLLANFPAPRRLLLERGVLWLAKYGLIEIIGRSERIPD